MGGLFSASVRVCVLFLSMFLSESSLNKSIYLCEAVKDKRLWLLVYCLLHKICSV